MIELQPCGRKSTDLSQKTLSPVTALPPNSCMSLASHFISLASGSRLQNKKSLPLFSVAFAIHYVLGAVQG